MYNSYNNHNSNDLKGWVDFELLDPELQAEIKERITAALKEL